MSTNQVERFNERERELADAYLAGPNRGCNCEECVRELAQIVARYGAEQRLKEAKWWHERFAVEPRYGCCNRLAALAATVQPRGEGE